MVVPLQMSFWSRGNSWVCSWSCCIKSSTLPVAGTSTLMFCAPYLTITLIWASPISTKPAIWWILRQKKSISSRFNPIKKHPQPSLPTNPQTLICLRFRYLVVVLFLHYATNADKSSTRHINRNYCLFMRNRSPLLFLSRRIYLSGVFLFCMGTQTFQKIHFGYPSKQIKAITEVTW